MDNRDMNELIYMLLKESRDYIDEFLGYQINDEAFSDSRRLAEEIVDTIDQMPEEKLRFFYTDCKNRHDLNDAYIKTKNIINGLKNEQCRLKDTFIEKAVKGILTKASSDIKEILDICKNNPPEEAVTLKELLSAIKCTYCIENNKIVLTSFYNSPLAYSDGIVFDDIAGLIERLKIFFDDYVFSGIQSMGVYMNDNEKKYINAYFWCKKRNENAKARLIYSLIDHNNIIVENITE